MLIIIIIIVHHISVFLFAREYIYILINTESNALL